MQQRDRDKEGDREHFQGCGLMYLVASARARMHMQLKSRGENARSHRDTELLIMARVMDRARSSLGPMVIGKNVPASARLNYSKLFHPSGRLHPQQNRAATSRASSVGYTVRARSLSFILHSRAAISLSLSFPAVVKQRFLIALIFKIHAAGTLSAPRKSFIFCD